MTGVGCRTMTLNNQLLLALSSLVMLILAGTPPALAVSATATVTLKATFTAPPCTITVPDQVFLGSMLPGEQSYAPFKVSVTCPGGSTATSALYAEVVSGSLTSGRTDRVDMNGPAGSSGTPAQLWLTAEGKTVALDGTGSTDDTKRFCTGTTDRQCSLIPSTLVSTGTPRGETTATIRVSVVYP